MPSLLNLRPFPNFITDTHFRSIPFCRKSFSNFAPTPSRLPVSSKAYSQDSKSSLSFLSPLEAILFDIDGTLCDSDPIHFDAFRIMLQEIGFNGGTPIDEEYFIKNISGKHNDELCGVLLPDWEFEKAIKFMVDKEAFFRSLKFGKELLRNGTSSGEAVLERLWYHPDAILCWSFKPVSVCLFANQSAYNMLDASLVNLHDIKPDQIFDRSFQEDLHTVLKQGYVKRAGGTFMSLKGISVKYDQVVVWIVEEGASSAATRLAFAFNNWSQGLNYA